MKMEKTENVILHQRTDEFIVRCEFKDFKSIFTPWLIELRVDKDIPSEVSIVSGSYGNNYYCMIKNVECKSFDSYKFGGDLERLRMHLSVYIPETTEKIGKILLRSRDTSVLMRLGKIPKIIIESEDVRLDVEEIIGSCEKIIGSYEKIKELEVEEDYDCAITKGSKESKNLLLDLPTVLIHKIYSYMHKDARKIIICKKLRDIMEKKIKRERTRFKIGEDVEMTKEEFLNKCKDVECYKLFMRLPMTYPTFDGRKIGVLLFESFILRIKELLLFGTVTDETKYSGVNSYYCSGKSKYCERCERCGDNMFSLRYGKTIKYYFEICGNRECIEDYSRKNMCEEDERDIEMCRYAASIKEMYSRQSRKSDMRDVILGECAEKYLQKSRYSNIKMHDYLKVNIGDSILFSEDGLCYPYNKIISEEEYKRHLVVMRSSFDYILRRKMEKNEVVDDCYGILRYFERRFNKKFLDKVECQVNECPFWWSTKEINEYYDLNMIKKCIKNNFDDNYDDLENLRNIPLKLVGNYLRRYLMRIDDCNENHRKYPKDIPKFVFDIYDEISMRLVY